MDLLDLFIKVAIDDQATDGISKIADKAARMGDTIGAIGAGISTAFTTGAAAVGAASTAISGIATAAVKSYAEYEQLAGGVETLFKASADIVQAYADNAFLTSGLSANEYMETVTSFSASLLQSLEGDTAAAADAAQQAIVDMADNANKMGTSMASIQNAYQGFAKQNYSMLDNLKLGYGGTAAEMYRLMETAASLDETFAKTANFSLDAKGHLDAEFADITKAIHIVQTEMGITGTTALEASSTISGSLASAGAAWKNLLTGIADDNADFGTLISNFVGSVSTAAENLIPRIQIALGGVADLVSEMAPVVMEAVPQLLESVLPGLAEGVAAIAESFFTQFNVNTWNMLGSAGTDMVLALGEGLIYGLTEIGDIIGEAADTIYVYFLESADQFTMMGTEILAAMATGIGESVGGLAEVGAAILIGIAENLSANLPILAETGTQIVTSLTTSFSRSASLLADAAEILLDLLITGITTGLPSLVSSGLEILESLMTGVISALPEITNAAVEIVVALVSSLTGMLPQIINTGVRLLVALVNNMPAIIQGIVEAIPLIIDSIVLTIVELLPVLVDAGVQLFTALIDNIPEILAVISDNLPALIEGIVDALILLLPALADAGFDLFVALIDKLPEIIDEVLTAIPAIVNGIIGALSEKWEDIKQAGKDLLSGLGEGITEGWDAIKESVSRTFSNITDFVKGIFDVHSPSRVFAGIGENLMEGLWMGVDGKVDSVMGRIGDAIRIPTAEIAFADSAAGKSSAALANTFIAAGDGRNGSGDPVNVNLVVGGYKLAEVLYDPLRHTAKQRGSELAKVM